MFGTCVLPSLQSEIGVNNKTNECVLLKRKEMKKKTDYDCWFWPIETWQINILQQSIMGDQLTTTR